jgi:transposase
MHPTGLVGTPSAGPRLVMRATIDTARAASYDRGRDGVSAWRIVDLCRIAEERFGTRYREGGMRRLVKALDLSWQKTRPRHPKADKAAQERFKKGVSPRR